MTATRNSRRTISGVVSSTGSTQTITVVVDRMYKHPKYGKYVRRQRKHHAHDEREDANVGDRVEIVSTRPLSKQKRWRLVRVIERATAIELDSKGDAS